MGKGHGSKRRDRYTLRAHGLYEKPRVYGDLFDGPRIGLFGEGVVRPEPEQAPGLAAQREAPFMTRPRGPERG